MSRPLVLTTLITLALVATSVVPAAVAVPPFGMSATRADPALLQGSPGQTLTVRTDIANVGSTDDTYRLSISGPASYAPTLGASTVGVTAGQTAQVSYTVTLPSGSFLAQFVLRIVSENDTNVNVNLVTDVETPIDVDVVLSNTRLTITGSSVLGVVSAHFLDGSPYVGASVLVRAHTNTPTPILIPGSARTVVTGASGSASFDLGQSPIDHTPGRHTVIGSIARAGTSAATGSAVYQV